MIYVLVMSDSHGDVTAVRKVLERHTEASVVIHLGDGAEEAMRVAKETPERTWHIVKGNCDYTSSIPRNELISVGGKRLYLTHGAYERVKSDLLVLSLTAKEQEADVALFGHTHIPATEFRNGMLLFNPGSIAVGAYGLLEISDGVYSRHLRLTD